MYCRRILLPVMLCLLSFHAMAGEKYAPGGFGFTFENDVFRNTDRGYTNGVRLSYITAEEDIPHFLAPLTDIFIAPISENIPFFPRDGKRRLSYTIGQSMFTPDDITVRSLVPQDRPYAGWLYGSVGITSDNGKHLDFLELTLGVVGSYSLAEQTQTFVHRHITDSPRPEGWDNQLRNEPGIILTYEHKWRNLYEIKDSGWGVDFTPHAGAALGNVSIYAVTGVTARFGYDLPSDYGPPRVRPNISGSDFFIPTKHVAWYLFAGAEGRAVARNIFLDGNTVANSHSVDKKPFIGDFQWGAAVSYKHLRLAYTNVYRTKEYKTQDKGDKFGTLTLSVRF